MNNAPHSWRPQCTNKFAGAMAKFAQEHTGKLEREFQYVAELRRDAEDWQELRIACAVRLGLRHEKMCQFRSADEALSWLDRMDERLEQAFLQLLQRADLDGGAAGRFFRSVTKLYFDTAHWTAFSGNAVPALWRHAALVWLSLRLAASEPNVTAAEASASIGLTPIGTARSGTSTPAIDFKKGWRLLIGVLSRTSWLPQRAGPADR